MFALQLLKMPIFFHKTTSMVKWVWPSTNWSLLFSLFLLLPIVPSTISMFLLDQPQLAGRRFHSSNDQRHARNWLFKRAESSEERECVASDLNSAEVQRAAAELLAGYHDAEQHTIESLASSKPRHLFVQYDKPGGFAVDASECPLLGEEETNNGFSSEEVVPGMPLELRSLCPFVYVENVDERRLPRRITEVKCLCERPLRASSVGVRCEPFQLEIPVLLFDSQCRHFRRVQQRVTLGCMAVFGSSSNSQLEATLGQEAQPGVLGI